METLFNILFWVGVGVAAIVLLFIAIVGFLTLYILLTKKNDLDK